MTGTIGRVDGTVALITGAARGQGRAAALRLAQEGADIIAVDACQDMPHQVYGGATRADLDGTVADIEALGRRVVASVADVRDLERLRTAVDEGVNELGRLDIVVANAGVGSPPHTIVDASYELWRDTIDINLIGVFLTAKVAVPHVVAGGRGGSIVLTSSAAGLRGYANIGHYVAAKHGVVGLMRTMALELGPERIRVNSIHPGTVDTPMSMNESIFKLFRPDLEAPTKEQFGEAAQTLATLPVPWVDAEDVANAVLFLASEEARYVTGVELSIDAGIGVK